MLQRFDFPLQAADHVPPHLVEQAQLLPGLDQREEHAELRAPKLLKEAAEHVVVVEEVLAPLRLKVRKWLLQLGERLVQHV